MTQALISLLDSHYNPAATPVEKAAIQNKLHALLGNNVDTLQAYMVEKHEGEYLIESPFSVTEYCTRFIAKSLFYIEPSELDASNGSTIDELIEVCINRMSAKNVAEATDYNAWITKWPGIDDVSYSYPPLGNVELIRCTKPRVLDFSHGRTARSSLALALREIAVQLNAHGRAGIEQAMPLFAKANSAFEKTGAFTFSPEIETDLRKMEIMNELANEPLDMMPIAEKAVSVRSAMTGRQLDKGRKLALNYGSDSPLVDKYFDTNIEAPVWKDKDTKLWEASFGAGHFIATDDNGRPMNVGIGRHLVPGGLPVNEGDREPKHFGNMHWAPGYDYNFSTRNLRKSAQRGALKAGKAKTRQEARDYVKSLIKTRGVKFSSPTSLF